MSQLFILSQTRPKHRREARYREAVVRLGDIAKQDESYTGYFEREEDLK